MGVVCVAEARIFADRFIANLSAVDGAPPTCLKPLGLRTFLLAAHDICDSVEQTCFIRGGATFASEKQGCQSQQQNISTLHFSPRDALHL